MASLFAYSNVLTAIGIGFTLVVGLNWVMPMLNRPAKCYYLYLLAWTIPYIIGQFSQSMVMGPIWLQYHLLDACYVQSSMAFGGALYVAIVRLTRRGCSQAGVFTWLSGLFVVAVIVSYGGEVWDTGWALIAYGSLAKAIDSGDYIGFTVGAILAITPIVLTKLPRTEATTS